MVSEKKEIPSWQRTSISKAADTSDSQPTSNDDPVYAQEEASRNSSNSPKTESSTPVVLNDPVYAQKEAASNTSVAPKNTTQDEDPTYHTQQEAVASSSSSSSADTPSSSTSQETSPTTPPIPAQTEPDPHLRSRSSLLASASKFLDHEDLAHAPLARKVAFLQEKGLSKEEIDGLLSFNQESAASQIPGAPSQSPVSPPIITYPEFLLHAHKPKPLVTRSRIISAVYATGLISGSLYLANRYLFEPMAEQMASARHELFSTALKGTTDLNEKLEKVVSVIPPKGLAASGSDNNSEAEDPEELFSRDIGVQTSASLETVPDTDEPTTTSKATTHATLVQDVRDHIKSLHDTSKDVLEEDEAMKVTVDELKTYLEELAYGNATRRTIMPWENGYNAERMDRDRDRLDEVAKFKAEIRSVKGALLSARNFPAGSGMGRSR